MNTTTPKTVDSKNKDSPEITEEANNQKQIVTFQIGSEEYSFDILDVREIIRPVRLTRIPLAPKHVKGVANLRGEVLPILELHQQFGSTIQDITEKSRILVIDHNEKLAGLYVDAVHQVTNVLDSEIESASKFNGGIQNKYLRHLAKLNDGKRIVLGLDPEQVCEIQIDQSLFEKANSSESRNTDTNTFVSEETFIAVTFMSDGVEYCLPIEDVQEIIRIRKPRQFPNSPKFVKGILSLRGLVVPILDLRILMGRPSIEDQKTKEIETNRNKFQESTNSIRDSLASGAIPKTLFKEAQQQIKGISNLQSSNDLLGKAYDSLRLSINSYLNALNAAVENPRSINIYKFDRLKKSAESEFTNCSKLLCTGSQSDQKIVVVRIGNLLAGLLVDLVKEVKSFPLSCIDSPPSIAKKTTNNLSGILKLDNGRRMILKLDVNQLISAETQKNLLTSVGNADKTSDKNPMNDNLTVSGDELQLVCFKIGEDEYGAPIEQIREIDRISTITAIPESPDYIDGITNLRGEVLTVVSLRKRFQLGDIENDDKSRIIVADIDGSKTGLRVDSVSHVIRIQKDIITGPPKEASDSLLNEFVTGIAKAENGKRIIILMNLKKLLTRTETES